MLLQIIDSFAYKLALHCFAIHCYPDPFALFALFQILVTVITSFLIQKTFCKLTECVA